MIYKYTDSTNTVVHVIDDDGTSRGSMLATALPEGAEVLPADVYVPTLADLAESVRLALQSAIDDKAKSFGFISGGNALMLYAGFVNPFQPLAQSFATWEASVWYEAELYKQKCSQALSRC
jgi:hypothetical protein